MDKTTDDSFFIKLFQNYLCHLLEDLFFHLFLRAYVSNAAELINQSINPIKHICNSTLFNPV